VSRHADDGVGLQEDDGRGRIVKIHLSGSQGGRDRRRDGIHVDFQTDRERGLRADAGSDASQLLAGNRAMQVERVAPERLVAECVVAKYRPAFFEHARG